MRQKWRAGAFWNVHAAQRAKRGRPARARPRVALKVCSASTHPTQENMPGTKKSKKAAEPAPPPAPESGEESDSDDDGAEAAGDETGEEDGAES